MVARTRQGVLPHLIKSRVDGKLCLKYRKSQKNGCLSNSTIICNTAPIQTDCLCQPCALCSKRIAPYSSEAAPDLYGPNLKWVGVHCLDCYKLLRPLFAMGM